MAFYPPRSPVSVEVFSEDEGFTLGDNQSVAGGKLSLNGTYQLSNPKLKWSDARWTQTSDFISYPNVQAPLDQWQFVSYDEVVVDPVFTGEYDQVEEIVGWDVVTTGGADPFPPKPVRAEGTTNGQWKRILKKWRDEVAKIKRFIKRQERKGFVAPPSNIIIERTPITEIKLVPRIEGQERVVLSQEYFFQDETNHWGTSVSNPDGYTIEIRAQMKSGTQRLVIDDGDYRRSILLKPDGLWMEDQLKLAVGWESEFKTIRLAGQNNELYMMNEDGFGFYAGSGLTSVSEGPLLAIGNTSDTEGLLLLDQVNQAHPGVFIDLDEEIEVVFPTDPQDATLPAFDPQREVTTWDVLVVRTDSADFSGGTVEVQVQYYNSNVGVWTNYSTPTSLTAQVTEIDISGVPVEGDGSDKIRVVITQTAASASVRPPSVVAVGFAGEFADEDPGVSADTSSYYDRGLDRGELLGLVCGTKSPFRMKDSVPDGDVSLAYISAPSIDPQANVALTDLSFIDSANIVTGAEQPFILAPDIDANTSYLYQDVNNNDLVIAAGFSSWGTESPSSPLFYGYLLGEGRYFLDSAQSNEINRSEVRDAILVHFEDGTPVTQEEYPWDIVVNTSDFTGAEIPDGAMSVVLMTGKKFLPNRTVFVSYPALDRSRSWKRINGRTEVVNPVELIAEGGSPVDFDADLDELLNTFDITVEL